jgi:serine/threonine-protein kinase HipA
MSIAGYQDKLLVYLDAPLTAGGRMFLAEPPLASTHILKPQPLDPSMPHLVVNEHYCMTLALRMGLPVAQTSLLRARCPVLVVTRFDRLKIIPPDDPVAQAVVKRLHVIDACQACDLPVSFKYERNIGNGEMVRHIRDGVSFEMLFARIDQTVNKAAARLHMLRWALFQFLIGNSDAHGKNYSFFVQGAGLEPAPWYDLVSVVQYPNVNHEMAMAYGDVFAHEEVKSFALADFAQRCGVDRGVLKREAARMAKLVQKHAMTLAQSEDYREDERAFVQRIAHFVVAQASRLEREAALAARIRDEFL